MTKAVTTSADAFVQEVSRLPARTSGTRGRLLFAMDATASREPTWDHACGIQGEMFVAAEALVRAVRLKLFSTAIPCKQGK